MLFLRPLYLNRDGTCTDLDVCEGKPSGRTIGRIYLDISTNGLADRGYAATRAKGDARAGNRWRERGPLKTGEMQVGTPKWMKHHPDYRHVIDQCHRLAALAAVGTTNAAMQVGTPEWMKNRPEYKHVIDQAVPASAPPVEAPHREADQE